MRDHYIPLWSQPGLIPRDAGRRDLVQNVAYIGRAKNLPERFRLDAFREAMQQVGLRFAIQETNWRDYHDVDVVLVARAGHHLTQQTKPATKLYNAWLAGCVCIGGQDPAIDHLRESQLDYLLAESPDDALKAAQRLRNEPKLFLRMQERGAARAAAFTTDTIATKWEHLLFELLPDRFVEWQHAKADNPRSLRIKHVRRRAKELWQREVFWHTVGGVPGDARDRMNKLLRPFAWVEAKWRARGASEVLGTIKKRIIANDS
jgi:hypothetical protein